MKRTIKGIPAYATIIGAKLPERTKSYTPISHTQVINRVRSEITNAGYVITGEDYRCSNNGDIATGSFRLNYKEDMDIELAANFMNSYNKQYAFRFNLGGMVKVCMNGMMVNNSKFGAYRRVHTGTADVLAEGHIAEYIKQSDEYWRTLVRHKDNMRDHNLTKNQRHHILGTLFFEENVLNGMQMGIVKSELAKPSFDYRVDPDSAWALYNHITLALKEGHPADWMNDQGKVHQVFDNLLYLEPKTASLPTGEPLTLIPKAEELADEAMF